MDSTMSGKENALRGEIRKAFNSNKFGNSGVLFCTSYVAIARPHVKRMMGKAVRR